MHKFFKDFCVLLLSVALLFTMTPMPSFAGDTVTTQGQTQVQDKDKKDKGEEKQAEPEKKETEPPAKESEPEGKDSGSDSGSGSGSDSGSQDGDSGSSGDDADDQGSGSDSGSSGNSDSGSDSDAEEPTQEPTQADQTDQTDPTDATDATDATEGTTEEAAKDPTKKEEEEKYPAQTLTANAGGVTVTLKAPEGALPEGSDLNAHQVGQRYINAVEAQAGELRDAVAIDVTPVDKDGREVQPKKTVSVTFSGTGFDMEAGDSVVAYRVSDNASSVTNVGGGGSANSQTFSTNHFTIYVTGTQPHETHPSSGSPYVLEYGKTLNLTDDNDSSSGWTVVNSSGTAVTNYRNYMSLGQGTTTAISVTNVNETGNAAVYGVRHGNSGSTEGYRYFYIRLLPKPTTVTVHFNLTEPDGSSSVVQTNVIESGGSVTAPSESEEATYDHQKYEFSGWCSDEACTTPVSAGAFTNITSDTEFYGKYTLEPTVTFNFMDAGQSSFVVAKTEQVKTGGSATAPDEPEEKTIDNKKYEFSGWCSDEACTTAADLTNITADTQVYGKYNVEPTVTFNLMDAGESSFVVDSSVQVKSGGSATAPEEPEEKQDSDDRWYEFSGWCSDEACETPATLTNITQDTQVYGKYTLMNHEVKFNLKDAEATTFALVHTSTVSSGDPVTDAPVEPSEKVVDNVLYEFSGWCTDEACETAADLTKIISDTEVYGKYEKKKLTVTFMFKDVGESQFTQETQKTVEYGGDVTDPPQHSDKTDEGVVYKFTDWCTTEGCQTKATLTNITRNTTVYGTYVPQVSLTYHPGTTDHVVLPSPNPVVAGAGTEVTLGTATREGYVQIGWKDNKTGTTYHAGDRVLLPSEGMDLYAQWSDEHINIIYYRNYDSTDTEIIDTETVPEHEYHELINTIPTRPQYLFLGWSTARAGDPEYYPEDEIETEESNIILFAIWGEFNDQYLETKSLTARGETLAYDGADHTLKREPRLVDGGPATWDCPVVETDKPQTHGDCKYRGYVRVGDYTVGSGHHHIYAYVDHVTVTGTHAGSYVAPDYAELFTHNSDTDEWETLGWFIPVTNTKLTITPIEVTVSTDSASKSYDGQPLTAGGSASLTIGESTVTRTFTHAGSTIQLLAGETLNIRTTGSQTTRGSSTNNYEVAWGDPTEYWGGTFPESTAMKHNYIIKTGNLGTLTVRSNQVKYDKNTIDAVTDMPANEEVTQTTYTLSAKEPKREHYTFDYWTTDAAGTGAHYEPGSSYTFPEGTDEVTFYAQWTIDEHDVVFDPRGGKYDGKTIPTTEKHDYNETFTLTAATRDHYQFKGWKANDAAGTVYQAGTRYKVTGDVTFTAQWEIDSFKVTFNPNGGTYKGTTERTVEPHNYGAEITFTAATRQHYQFKGWKANDAAGTVYQAGQKYTVEGPVTFTAQWEIDKFQVTFDPNGGEYKGTTDPTSETHNYGDRLTFTAATREHYQFKGWKADDAAGTVYQVGDEYTVTKKVTFTAQWEADKQTLTFDPDGGSFDGKTTPTEVKEPYDKTIKIPKAATRDGFVFLGWQASGGKVYQPGNDYEVMGDETFTALWAEAITITYDPQGGTFRGSKDPTKVDYGAHAAITVAEAATRDHYKFLEWNTAADGSGESYQPGMETEFAHGTTLYAVWQRIHRKITYVPNGGVFRGSTVATVIDYLDGETITIAEAPTREGYTFLYWKGSEYQPGDEHTVVDDHVFVAQWQKNDDPIDPDDPDDPDEPDDPDDKEKKEKQKDEEKDDEVETGDMVHFEVFILFLLAAALSGIVLFRRREQKE